jgi:hypothetical protein
VNEINSVVYRVKITDSLIEQALNGQSSINGRLRVSNSIPLEAKLRAAFFENHLMHLFFSATDFILEEIGMREIIDMSPRFTLEYWTG